MTVSESQRRALHQRLVEVLGMDDADALMEHLPPSGWADVARRSDIDYLHLLMATEMSAMEARLRREMQGMRGDLLEKMAEQTRTLMVGMTATVVAALGTVAALSVVVR